MFGSLIPALFLVGAQSPAPAGLTLDQLFPKKSYFGKTATEAKWSADDKYLTYLWNDYDAHGMDLWLFDAKEGKARPLTSLASMMPYDRDLKDISERYKKEKVEDDRRKNLTEVERKKLEDEDDKKILELNIPSSSIPELAATPGPTRPTSCSLLSKAIFSDTRSGTGDPNGYPRPANLRRSLNIRPTTRGSFFSVGMPRSRCPLTARSSSS